MKITETDRESVVGIAGAYNDVGCSNQEGATAFYDMGLSLVTGKTPAFAFTQHEELGATYPEASQFHYKENN